LLLGVCDAAEGGAKLHRDAVGGEARGVEAGVFEGEPCRGDGELRVAVEPTRGAEVHEALRLEVVDLGGDAGAPGRRVEAGDAADRRALAAEPLPQRVHADAGGGDRPEARNGDAVGAVRAVAGDARDAPAAGARTVTCVAAEPALPIGLTHAPPPQRSRRPDAKR